MKEKEDLWKDKKFEKGIRIGMICGVLVGAVLAFAIAI
jgi:hypothetical protein